MSADATKRKPEDAPAEDESVKRVRTETGAVPATGNGPAPTATADGASATATAPAAGSTAAAPANGTAAAPAAGAAPAATPQGAGAANNNPTPAPAPAPATTAAPQPNSVTDTLSRMSEDEKAKTTIQSLCVACTCLLSYPGSAVLIRCPNCDTITPRPEEAWFAPPPAPVSDLKRQASQWNLNQVLVFIQNMGLQHLAPTFQAHSVNGARLIELQRQQIIEELGIRNEADVAGLLAVVDVLRTVPPTATAAPAPAAAPTAAAPAK